MASSDRLDFRPWWAAAAVALSALALASCGDGSSPTPSSSAPATTGGPTPMPTPKTVDTAPSGPGSNLDRPPHHRARPASGSHRGGPDRPPIPPGVQSALHAYIAALDAHDGERLCALFRPGALDELQLPEGSGCPGLSASIGYRGPHGLPVWSSARVDGIRSVVDSGAGVRATVTIVDRYAGNPQPSIEDDVVYLAHSGGRWLIEKPSVTVYRAIGTPDPPPSVLAAP